MVADFVAEAVEDEDEFESPESLLLLLLLLDEELSSVAPVAAIRESTSDWVVQVTLVPALFTKGRAAQLKVQT